MQMNADEYGRIERIDALADRLLKQDAYAGMPATEVWDAAAEQIDAQDERARAWAADRQMVSDMERDGLLSATRNGGRPQP